ncbi:MAG: hypothetical protein QOD71_1120 [Thermoleophilaceae bacterium]|nr:hypothetical protein [Thermoleophilaceae bacterium]
MSRRRQRTGDRPAEEAAGPERPPAEGDRAPGRRAPGRREPRLPFLAQAGILVAVFAIVSLVADLAGAANLGVALGIGQVAFAIALVAVILKT